MSEDEEDLVQRLGIPARSLKVRGLLWLRKKLTNNYNNNNNIVALLTL